MRSSRISKHLPKLLKRLILQGTVSKKIGGIAIIFVILLSSLSGYSFFNSWEIRRELEETIYSDIPLFRISSELKEHNQRHEQIVELLLLSQNQLDTGFNKKNQELLQTLHESCNNIHEIIARGIQQAELAKNEEIKKEGHFRLNKSQENYQEIIDLFKVLSAYHQSVDNSLESLIMQISSGAEENLLSPQSFSVSTIYELEKSLGKIKEVIQEISSHLDAHMQNSLDIALQEQKKLKFYNVLLCLIAITLGSALTIFIINQLFNSLERVTKKAKLIAEQIEKNQIDYFNQGLSSQELLAATEAGKEILEISLAFNKIVDSLAISRQLQQETQRILAEEQQLTSFTLKSIGDGVITTNKQGFITSVNLAAEKLIGSDIDQLKGRKLAEVFHQRSFEPENSLIEYRSKKTLLKTVRNCQGQENIFDISHAPICSESGEILGEVIVFRDMTQSVNAAKKLSWQATHDALTHLANRREFQNQLEALKQQENNIDSEHAILYLDLDRFKIVNDTCGHAAGDQLLKQISQHINHEVRSCDLVARLGGDEFGIILKNCSLEEAIKIAEKILVAVQQFRFIWNERQFSLGVSIGVVRYFPYKDDPMTILKAADSACYQAKNQGRNQLYSVSDQAIHLANQNQEMNWLALIHQALENDHFLLFQQKIISLDQEYSEYQHYEVLIRMKTEDGSILSPGAFLPIAERYQLMSKIDRWVISHFFSSQNAHLRAVWRQQKYNQFPQQNFYSLNLSSESLNDPQFLNFLEEQLTRYQIPPELICFEITETTAITNLKRAKQIIQAIRSLGCRFALDDFGSGMSSFGYLQTLPIDFLKIDGQFIRQLCQNPMNTIIVQALQQVAQAVNIKTIAEFVEDYAILEKLREIGVDYAQGYGIAKPIPLRQLQLLSDQTSAVSSSFLTVENKLDVNK